jgi:hypothetical protein
MMETKADAPSLRGWRQVVELLDFGKLMSTCGRCPSGAALEHGGQAVQGLRAEDDVHIGRALDDGGAFLAGHAATHADHHALFS